MRPQGLINVAIANSLMALVTLAGLFSLQEEELKVLAAAAVVVWILIGPALLIRHRLVWRLSRPLVYFYAMCISLLVVFAILNGTFLAAPFIFSLQMVVVIYLIGVRGYLNTTRVRAYFGVEPSVK